MTEKVLSVTKPDAIADFKEGVSLLKNGYAQRALPRLRKAFECEKRNPYYLSFLGLCVARAERKWDQASELCEIAVQLKRSEVQFHLNLAEVYQLAGRRSKAIEALDAALERFSDDDRLKRARSRAASTNMASPPTRRSMTSRRKRPPSSCRSAASR